VERDLRARWHGGAVCNRRELEAERRPSPWTAAACCRFVAGDPPASLGEALRAGPRRVWRASGYPAPRRLLGKPRSRKRQRAAAVQGGSAAHHC